MKLYHCQGSRSVRPLWTLEEMGLDYTLVSLRFPPRVHHKDYLSVNPLGTVPALLDAGAVLTESVAICQHLVSKHGPSELDVAANETDYPDFLNWLHRADATFTFPLTLVLRYTRLEPEDRRQPQVAEDYRRWFLGRWRAVERVLEHQEHLCADRFTLADICVGYACALALHLGIDATANAAVARWWRAISGRPAARVALAGL